MGMSSFYKPPSLLPANPPSPFDYQNMSAAMARKVAQQNLQAQSNEYTPIFLAEPIFEDPVEAVQALHKFVVQVQDPGFLSRVAILLDAAGADNAHPVLDVRVQSRRLAVRVMVSRTNRLTTDLHKLVVDAYNKAAEDAGFPRAGQRDLTIDW